MSVKSSTSIGSTSKGRLPRLNLHNALIKQRQTFDKSLSSSPSILLSSNGTLSPNLQPPTPPIIATNQNPHICLPSSFGDKYILVEQIEASNLYKCIDTKTHNEFCCKIVPTKNYHEFLSGHLRMDGHSGINRVEEVLVAKSQTFILFSPSFGDLHSYVRNKKRLRESEAMHLFHQIVNIVSDCHSNGIILRDLKLRKFLFSDKERYVFH
jgi:tribbles-like protein